MAIAFEPGTKPYRSDYPELNDIDEFDGLSDAVLVYLWHFACRESPFKGLPEGERSAASIIAAEKLSKLSKHDAKRFSNLEFLPQELTAIDRMGRFNVDVRKKAKEISEKIFNNLQFLINMEEEDLKTLEMSEKKAYSSMVIDIHKQMPDLVLTKEVGFSVRNKKAGTAITHAEILKRVKQTS